MIVLLLRIAALQLFWQANYADAAERNSIRTRELRAPRGLIVDRNGTVLAANRIAFDLYFTIDSETTALHIPATAKRLAGILGEPPETLETRLREAGVPRGRPKMIARDILPATLAEIAWQDPFLPGVDVEPAPAREYLLDSTAAHVLGYVGEISAVELDVLHHRGYRQGDLLGKAGVERSWDTVLRGRPGLERYEADPRGRPVRQLGLRRPSIGSTLALTIDARLQRWSEEALSGKEGAVVIIEPATGDVLALASAPGFQPNAFSDRNLESQRLGLLTDPSMPLLSRALLAAYPPASTFKLVTMIAALRSDSYLPERKVFCTGSYRGQRCWRSEGHGSVDLADAFANSCDVYFYQLGEMLGIDPILRAGAALGVTSPSNLGLGAERIGLIPTPEWERANVRGADGEHWGMGDVRNTAIGQGYVLATPIAMARAYAAALSGGSLPSLRVVRRATHSDGSTVEFEKPAARSALLISASDQRTMRAALRAVVTRGTAWPLRSLAMDVGAKTGTAENPHGDDHAWMVAATPLDRPGPPDLVIAVLVVHGEHGSSGAGPIVRYVLERWNKTGTVY